MIIIYSHTARSEAERFAQTLEQHSIASEVMQFARIDNGRPFYSVRVMDADRDNARALREAVAQ
jgi:hypothetical protein